MAVGYLDQRVRELGYESYVEYLAGVHWRAFRQKVMAERCFCCFREELLYVHHVSYDRLGAENKEDVVCVCRDCHDAIHVLNKEGCRLLDAHFKHIQNLRKFDKPTRRLLPPSKTFKRDKCRPPRKSKIVWVPFQAILLGQEYPTHATRVSFMIGKKLTDGIRVTELARNKRYAKEVDGQVLWNPKRVKYLLKWHKICIQMKAQGRHPSPKIQRRALIFE